MIKVNELRIGNFIVDDDGALSKIIGFKPYEHSVRCDEEEGCDILIDIHGADGKVRTGYAVESTEASPIPLTPEWLERCGFLQMEFKYSDGSITDAFIQKGRRYIVRQIDIQKGGHPYYAMEYFPYPQSHNCIPSELRYLHQLQNLYFALTGEELTINNEHLQSTS